MTSPTPHLLRQRQLWALRVLLVLCALFFGVLNPYLWQHGVLWFPLGVIFGCGAVIAWLRYFSQNLRP